MSSYLPNELFINEASDFRKQLNNNCLFIPKALYSTKTYQFLLANVRHQIPTFYLNYSLEEM